MVCHGCHTQIGQVAHQGSQPGKNLCTLPHSLSCQGGITENESWRACPPGYVFHGQSIPAAAFDNTMNLSDFITNTPNTNINETVAQHFGTAGSYQEQLQQVLPCQSVIVSRLVTTPSFSSPAVYTTPTLTAEQVQYDNLRQLRQQMGEGVRPRTSSAQESVLHHMGQFPTSNLPDSVQQLAESLRTRNQQVTQQQVSTDLDIAQLREMEELRGVVADQL